MVLLLWRTVWMFLKKIKTELPYDQQFYSWVYIPKRQKLTQKDTCIPLFTAALLATAKT